MIRWLAGTRSLLGIVLSAAPLLVAAPTAMAQDAPHCPPGVQPQYVFGFEFLHKNLGAVMGDPLTCEFADPVGTGDTLQLTTEGLAYWRSATNTPTFTNGWDHWAWTEQGLLHWAGPEIDPPDRATVVPPPVLPPEPDPVPPCLQDNNNFAADGHIQTFDRAPADARLVQDFVLGLHPGCERLVIHLGATEEIPAEAVGRVQAEFLRDQGVVRVHLGEEFDLADLVGTETDVEFDGTMIDRAFLVRSLDMAVWVDVHLADPVLARVLVLDSPARIVVDVQPGGAALPPPAVAANNVVVLHPRAQEPPATASYPLTITGYARTFEANVIARIRSNQEVDVENFTTAASWAETWGEFELTLPDGPRGQIELFVGELSARDGSEQGVRIPLVME